jgi:hypothetical protein
MAISLASIAAKARTYPARASQFGGVLAKLAESVKAYIDSGSVTFTNKTLTSPVINTGVSGSAILNDDSMATASETTVPTSESVKAYVDAQVTGSLIGGSGGVLIDNDLNVAGLASAIVLANSLKVTMNLHYADAGESGEEHAAASTAIAGGDASDLASILSLTGEMLTSYAAHDDDAILGSPVIHQAQGDEKALVSAVTPTTLTQAIARLVDLKAKLNDHMDDATAHTAGDSAQEAADDAAMGAAVDVVVAGVAVSDICQWSILDDGTNDVTGVSAVAASGKVVFTFSGDPAADTIVSYVILRSV